MDSRFCIFSKNTCIFKKNEKRDVVYENHHFLKENMKRRSAKTKACFFAWLGLAWLGLAWLGLAWLGLFWLGLAWLGLACFGLAWLVLAWLVLAWLCLAWFWVFVLAPRCFMFSFNK